MARRATADRLDGINLLEVLDIDGTGTINRKVLARTLRRFDENVFTEETVAELMEVIGGEDGDLVQLSDLRDILGRPATSSGRPARPCPSPKAHQRGMALDSFMDAMICDVSEFRQCVETPMARAANGASSPQELLAIKLELKQRAKDHMQKAQRSSIRPLWDEFDKDQNGVLTADECRSLVSAYLQALVPKSDDMVRGSIELGMELSVLLSEQKCEDAKAKEELRAQAKKRVDALCARVAPVVQETLSKMVAEDPGTIAAELLADLDLNKDGKVTRDEFEQRFVEAMHQVMGPERMVDKLQRASS
eukprot:gnl/TRDRNA2_/TRDRNA2_189805_c0_seq1.p1 gnl/TRDRNA2_/TRDRNA2_189805_c0~~gnl/TRDRNA2_/TRDRNA2_189805_c0_seq1.p1  ORF type:complete len:306 (-),score=67.66 gnl/TRDRNA2_/TRDRNA2_189805_c0_seq1:101-1018(-)